ncbi:GH92 family glycosyl hydrolase [Pedobacter immunditicola]|uniref:GH92 family glycosyl hydrolase n=1 Tax=Pedobacter immunditicola TaxID=3133440 RepID=UPI00309E3C12
MRDQNNNRIRRFITCILLLSCGTSLFAQLKSNVQYVNPFIGTTKSSVITRWGGNGGTYPGAVAPSGNIQISPETRTTGAKGYDYTDNAIYYFSCIKHMSGFPEGSAGHVFIMPVKHGQAFEAGKYKRQFSHQDEKAEPGYYRVIFKDDMTIAEASADVRSGILKFTFPAKVTPQIFVGDMGEITIIGKHVLHGTKANTVINISDDFLEKKMVKGGYLLTFRPGENEAKIIELKISTSTVSFSGAQRNIDAAFEKLNFELYRKRSLESWSKELAVIEVADFADDNKTVFYTALYHSLLVPWVVSDVDGKYKGADGIIYQATGKYEYGAFSPWDTFRSLHPLLSILYPEKQKDVIVSMLNVYQQTGHLPTESMTGNHAVAIIVDAYLKGITGYDSVLAYTAMKKNIMERPFVQHDLEVYHQLGYVPFSNSESVTRTMEYAYNDWALSRYAKLVMKNEQDYQLLQKRGLNYRNLFHAEELFMLPRKDKEFKLNPEMNGYKEGDKWIYTYFVPHNAKDLVNLLGGNTAFSSRLDAAMTNNVILYDNETVIHLPYLFNAAGYPHLTQKWNREIMLNRYADSPGGLPGNDDLGSMSSAYLFNAMGIFPVSPGNPFYAISAPLFSSVKLHLGNQKTLTIKAQNQSPENKYIKSLTVNNQPFEQLAISHELLMKGGIMEYTLSKDSLQTWPKDRDPLALSETKSTVHTEILEYAISKNKVEPNEEFWVRFKLKNTGSLGTKKVTVFANGRPWLSRSFLVQEGSTLTDSISSRLYHLGEVTIGINASVGTKVKVSPSSKPVAQPFHITGLMVKPVVLINNKQQIVFNIKNVTGKTQEFSIPVAVNDTVIFTTIISLLPGEQKAVSKTFNAGKTGLKTIKVDHLQMKYKVYGAATESLLMDLDFTGAIDGMRITDRSGFGNHGMIKGAVSRMATGKEILLGDSCYIEIPKSASLDKMEENITMMAWVNPDADETGLIDLFTKGDSHVLQTGNNKTLTFFAGGWGRGDCTVDLPADWKKKWHHITGVCKGNVLSVYINGQLAGSSIVDGVVNLSVASQWQIGRNEEFPSERVFHGKIDKVKIYEQPLSAAEILVIYNDEKAFF